MKQSGTDDKVHKDHISATPAPPVCFCSSEPHLVTIHANFASCLRRRWDTLAVCRRVHFGHWVGNTTSVCCEPPGKFLRDWLRSLAETTDSAFSLPNYLFDSDSTQPHHWNQPKQRFTQITQTHTQTRSSSPTSTFVITESQIGIQLQIRILNSWTGMRTSVPCIPKVTHRAIISISRELSNRRMLNHRWSSDPTSESSQSRAPLEQLSSAMPSSLYVLSEPEIQVVCWLRLEENETVLPDVRIQVFQFDNPA